MQLASMVTLVVLVTVAIIAAIGVTIDRSAD